MLVTGHAVDVDGDTTYADVSADEEVGAGYVAKEDLMANQATTKDNANDRGEIWYNGQLLQEFQEKQGNVILTNAANISDPGQLAIKVKNIWGSGSLRGVTLITDEAYQVRNTFDLLLMRVDRMDRFFQRHPSPDPALLSNIAGSFQQVLESDQDMGTKLRNISNQ